jgi:hypothetical protein
MRTAFTVSAMFVAMLLPSRYCWAQRPAGHAPIRIVLPPRLQSTRCELRYSHRVSGNSAFTGFDIKLNASEFEIETVHDGELVEALKAVLYCPGYQLQTLTFNSLPDAADRTVTLNPQPQGAIRLVGQVRGLVIQNFEKRYVYVSYLPWWTCEFFGFADCALGGWPVATAELSPDGRFSAMLPDFVRDPAISAFAHHGRLDFRIRDPKTYNTLFELKPAGNDSPPFWNLPVASSYAGVQVFDAELPR